MLKTLSLATLSPADTVPAGASSFRNPSATQKIKLPAKSTLAASLLLGVLVVAIYGPVGVKLVRDWYTIPDYSHGLLIPFFVAYLLWNERASILAVRIKPSWGGLWLVALGLFLLLVGRFGADLFLSRTSFLLLAGGLFWTLLGWAMLRQMKFALFVCFLAIPFPTLILNHITFPLQIFASSVASDALPLAGVPVLRDGNVIRLPAMALEVAEACSGIRSLMSLFTIAVIFGYFFERATWRRTLLGLAAVPIAVAANVARIVGTGLCVQYWDPVKAMGFFHEFSGWLMFIVSLTCLYLVHTIVDRISPESVPVHMSGAVNE